MSYVYIVADQEANTQLTATLGDQARPDVVWNATSSLWQCCGINDQGSPECDSPTNQTFTAPGPASLIQYFSISANFKATSTSIASSASTRGSSSTTAAGAAHTTSDIVGAASAASQPRPSSGQSSSLSSAPAPSSSNVSPGVIVGIAIGCALAGLVLMLLAGLIFFRWYAARWKREQIAELGCNVSKHIEELPADEPLSRAATVRDVRPLRRSILEIGNASTANLQRFEVAERGSGFWPFARTHGGDHQNV